MMVQTVFVTVLFQKISIPTPRKLLEIPRGRGYQKPKLKYEAKLEFPEGGGRGERVQTKKPSVAGVWIFSGTTQQN